MSSFDQSVQCSCSAISGEEAKAAVAVGRLCAQILASAKLAVLFSNRNLADDALRLAADVGVAGRRLGDSWEMSEELTGIGIALHEQLRKELSEASIANRQRESVDSVIFDGDGEELGSPFIERALGHWATVATEGLVGEFWAACSARVSLRCRQWLQLAACIEQALYPRQIVKFVFPASAPVAQRPVLPLSSNPADGSLAWIFDATANHLPIQELALGEFPIDYAWQKWVEERGCELGIRPLMSPLDEVGPPVSNATAVERAFATIAESIRKLPTTGEPADESDQSVTAEVDFQRNPPRIDKRPAPREAVKPESVRASDRLESNQTESKTFVSTFKVVIDEARKALIRLAPRRESLFATKGNRLTWKLAKFLLTAENTGRSMPEMREKWAEFGGNAKKPSERTIENAMTHVKQRLALIGLTARRRHHGPYLILEQSRQA